MTELKVGDCTPGPWYWYENFSFVLADVPQDINHKSYRGFDDPVHDGKYLICESVPLSANAQLIAEAGTVAHETGLTPRQLLQQRDELREALDELLLVIDSRWYQEALKDASIKRIISLCNKAIANTRSAG